MAEIEQSQRTERGVNARKRYTEQGRYMYPKPPFGYLEEWKLTDGKPEQIAVPDPATYHLLEELPRLILVEHLSDAAIVERWNKAGYRHTTGKPFSAQALRRIRSNPFYAGLVTFGAKRITKLPNGKIRSAKNLNPETIKRGDHGFPRPWTIETFEAMQTTKAARRSIGGRATNSKSPFTGVLKCGYCGYSMMAKVISPADRPAYKMVVCGHHASTRTECQPNRWRMQLVWETFEKEIDTLAANEMAGITPEILEVADNTMPSLSQALEAARRELEQIEPRRKRINLAFQKEAIGLEDYQEQLNDLTTERTALVARVATLEGQLATSTDRTQKREKLRDFAIAWKEHLKAEIAAAGPVSLWPVELVQRVKFEVVQRLFSRVEVREPDDLPHYRKKKKRRKERIHLDLWYK
jgi:site-specific DNA recombinase